MGSQQHQSSESEKIPASLQETHDVLLSASKQWREHLPFTSSLASHLVRQTRQKAQQEKGKMIDPPHDRPKRQAILLSTKGYLVSALGILLVVIGVVSYTFYHHNSVTKGVAPPPVFLWTPPQDEQNLTPQEAFAQGVTLTPCQGTVFGHGATPLNTRVTWVGTNVDFGLAFIRVQCPEKPYIVIFSMNRNSQHAWIPSFLLVGGRNVTLPTQDASPVPQWLNLPPANYGGIYTTGAGKPSILLRGWDTTTQLFVGGTVSTTLTYPSHGTAVKIGGYSGVVAQDQEIVLILVTLAPEKTFLFVGTADVANTQQLALAMLNHLSELASL